MKRIIIAFIAVGLALALSFVEYYYISSSTSAYLEMLEEADGHVEKNEMYEAQEAAKRLDNRYSKESRVLDMFMFHSEVRDVSASIASLRRYAQAGDASEFLAASARIKRTLTALNNNRLPRGENIF